MYITTSRKPSQNTRTLAHALSSFLSARYESRGKKSIEDVVTQARAEGHSRVLVIGERHGNPNGLSFIRVNSSEWSWMRPEIIFSVSSAASKMKRLDKQVRIKVAKSLSEVADLFDMPELTDDDVVDLAVDQSEIALSYGKQKLKLLVKSINK